MSQTKVVPATFRYVAFYDLLADAAFQHTLASLGIPKQATFWSKDASLSVLRVVCDFFRYLFVEVMKADDEALHRMLPSRLEFGNVLMPAVFDEFTRETAVLKKDGIDFSFLKVTSSGT